MCRLEPRGRGKAWGRGSVAVFEDELKKAGDQAVQDGYIVKVVKHVDAMPVPRVIATYSGDRTAPACNTMTYDD